MMMRRGNNVPLPYKPVLELPAPRDSVHTCSKCGHVEIASLPTASTKETTYDDGYEDGYRDARS